MFIDYILRCTASAIKIRIFWHTYFLMILLQTLTYLNKSHFGKVLTKPLHAALIWVNSLVVNISDENRKKKGMSVMIGITVKRWRIENIGRNRNNSGQETRKKITLKKQNIIKIMIQ